MENIKIKITTNVPGWPLIRQTPNAKGVWENCQFYIDDDTADCDWWVVFDGMVKEKTVLCHPDNTILVTCEPPSIKKYEKSFVRQFNTVITAQDDIVAPNTIRQQMLPWYIGAHFSVEQNRFDRFTKGYDELKQAVEIQKTKRISVISSNKTNTAGHRQRLRFIAILKEHFKDQLDVFGSGVNIIADKWDGIAPYAYHIAIENSVANDYWTEKLADSFLSESYPFYYGCPNINDYFSENSLTKIDIYKPEEAIATIEKAMHEDFSGQRKQYIKEAKGLILDHYQLFPALRKIVNESFPRATHKTRITLKPEVPRKKNILLKIRDKLAVKYRALQK